MALTQVQGGMVANNAITATNIAFSANTISGNVIFTNSLSGNTLIANTVSNTSFQTGSVENYMSAQGTPFGNRNKIINGAMMIDQRNAGAAVTVSGDSFYCVDRFVGFRNTPVNNFTLQQSSTAPTGFTKSLVATMGTGASPGATGYATLAQYIEGFNIADLMLGTANASPFTLSFWVRCSVNGTFGVSFRSGSILATYCATYTINNTNTWEYKTITIPAITSGTWPTDNTSGIQVFWDLGIGTTYSGPANQLSTGGNYSGVTGVTKLANTTGATFYITGVQLEKGATATPFENRLYGTELALCQRYYETSNGVMGFVSGATGFSTNTYTNDGFFKVTKRTTPTMTVSKNDGTANQCQMWKSATEYVGTIPNFETLNVNSFGCRWSNASVTDAGLVRYQWTATAEL